MRVCKCVIKMVVIVSIIYGLCWILDIVIFVLILFSFKFFIGGVVDIIFIVLVVCNLIVNFIVYVYLND